MMEGEGMACVVRGLRHSGLAVTLLDGCRQYTLVPNQCQNSSQQHTQPHNPHVTAQCSPQAPQGTSQYPPHGTPHAAPMVPQMSVHPISAANSQQSNGSNGDQPMLCDSGSQATDGRYASVYQTAHCKVTPTSPPVQLTEFPPQRAELCRGHGNFEVGGLGSGENYVPCRANGSFRGAMSWPDRGAVCSPRPSREPDAFANSLRKYPQLPLERSTEMVERLITYTQAKNFKTYQNRYHSPSRQGIDQNSSSQLMVDRSSSRNATRTCSYQKSYDDVNGKPKSRLDESPTRDLRPNECECDYRRSINSPKKKDNIRSLSYTVPFQQPVISVGMRYDHCTGMTGHKTPSLLTATNSVNMEVQVSTEMVSREVATVPRPEPFKRTVAVPLSPTSSGGILQGDVSNNHAFPTYKSVETSSMPVDLSIQTSSNTDICKQGHQCRCLIIERKSKSEERINVEKEFSDEIMELLDSVSVCPNADPRACNLRKEVLKQMSNKLQEMTEKANVDEIDKKKKESIESMLKFVPVWVPCGDAKSYREAISEEIINKMNDFKVYRAETQIRFKTKDSKLEDLLYKVISNLPIKTLDIFGKPVEKNHIVETFVKRSKRLVTTMTNLDDMDILKAEILVLLSKIPIAISTYNKTAYLNKIIDSLIGKLKTFYFSKDDDDKSIESDETLTQNVDVTSDTTKRLIQPTEEEIGKYISKELNLFLKKSHLHVENIKDLETDLIDILIDSIHDLHPVKTGNLSNEIMLLLLREVDGITESQATQVTERILNNVIRSMKLNPAANENEDQSSNIRNSHKANLRKSELNKSLRIGVTSKEDINGNLDTYMSQLTKDIDDWLENLNVNVIQSKQPGFREVVVNDLARDIIDRQKYVQLNPSSKGTESDELEHLRYQIFKWINKLVGEDNLETIRKAPELMQRIQSIPFPTLCSSKQDRSQEHHRGNEVRNNGASTSDERNNVLVYTSRSNVRLNQINQSLTNKSNNIAAPCCSKTNLKPTSPSTKKLNEEYDAFLQKWVEDIPIPTKTPKEKAIADKARMGIYNGIWKAVTKLKFELATFHNPFYYEDALDDEIEELLSSLPKSQELETKKYLLKVQLIEKTTNTNALIKAAAEPASFKEQLVNSVLQNLPQNHTFDGQDTIQPFEELQARKIVENYILCTKYKEEDKTKASIYRKKLVTQTQTLVENLKKTHGQELKDINPDLYVNSVLNALQKVPLPNEETIKDEANEILISQEVEQWFKDIPLVQENNITRQSQRNVLKDELVKKVHEIEKEVNILDCSGEKVVVAEVSQFLEKLPLEPSENENIRFMAEELTNRIKNRARQEHNNERRKSVSFMDSAGYYEFSQNMPHCSSFSKSPGAIPAVRDQSSYMIRGEEIIKDDYGYRPQMDQMAQSYKHLASDQFFTMEDSQAPQDNRYKTVAQQQIQNEEFENQAVPRSPSNIGSIARQQSPCCRNATNERRYSISQQPQMQSEEWHSIPIATPTNVQTSPDRVPSPCCRNPNSRRLSPVNTEASKGVYSENINTSEFNERSRDMNQQANENLNRTGSPYRRSSNAMQYIDQNENQLASERSQHQNPRDLDYIPIDSGANVQGLPSNMSYGQPQGFSTPQQEIRQGSPQKPGRKRGRIAQNRRDLARRRLDLDDDTEVESEEEHCRCFERMFRSRRPVCYAYDDCEMDEAPCYPMPYSYPCFY